MREITTPYPRRLVAFGLSVALIAFVVWFVYLERRPLLDGPAMLVQVRNLNQLTTVKYTIQKVVGLEEFKDPVGAERLLLVLQATVEAGVDLASLRPEQVQRRADGAVVIRLPPARLFTVAVDEKETRVWDRQKTWWTPWIPYSLELEKKARIQGLEAARKAALEMGILKQAERNAETSIRGLLGMAGVKNIVVIPESVT